MRATFDPCAQEREAQARLRPERHQLLSITPVTKCAPVVSGGATTKQEAVLMAAPSSMTTRPVKRGWYEHHEDFAAVAIWAKDDGSLTDREVWEYIESPWDYDHLYAAWMIWVAAENAADHRVDAYLEAGAL